MVAAIRSIAPSSNSPVDFARAGRRLPRLLGLVNRHKN
jgi:hypothetical protein